MGRKISGSEFIIGYLSIFNDAFDLDLRKSTKIEDNKDLSPLGIALVAFE